MALNSLLVTISRLDLGAEIFDERLSAAVYTSNSMLSTQYFLTVNLTLQPLKCSMQLDAATRHSYSKVQM